MNMLRRFLYGRNGPDQLSLSVLIFGLILSIAAMFIPAPGLRGVLQLIDYFCMAYFFFRVISRNVYKRREENLRFLQATHKTRQWFRLHWRMVRECRTHRYVKCPGCGQTLRVPKGKGKILISCQNCREQFEKTV